MYRANETLVLRKKVVGYRLTEKGIDLAPMLVEMIIWAATHEVTDAPPEVVREMIRNRRSFLAKLRATWSEGQSAGA